MALFDKLDDLRGKATEMMQTGVDKATEMMQAGVTIAKLKTDNIAEEDAMRRAYLAIGKTALQAGSSIVFPPLRRRSIRYCGLHTPAGHLPGAGFHCGRCHAFPGSASLAGHIHRTVFRHSGKQRRQPQTVAGCAEQS